MMSVILSVAIAISILTVMALLVGWFHQPCLGSSALSSTTFLAVLFTSGLDVGLIMFPLVDFRLFDEDPAYGFSNPLAIEFGFWGFFVWIFYFLSTVYFCLFEPKLQLFEKPIIKIANNIVVICTCAFTAYLFFVYLPTYIEGISWSLRWGLLISVISLAILSSTRLMIIKYFSVLSFLFFLSLIAWALVSGDLGFTDLAWSLSFLGDYFVKFPHFVLPLNDYHSFYLFWWFAWSLMIGQFVARFAPGLPIWQLLLVMLVVPSIPIALWFSVLYLYFFNSAEISQSLGLGMIAVGVVFVINSLDSLIRLYTANLRMSLATLGKLRYFGGNAFLLIGLVILYFVSPLKIEWIGMIVIALYTYVYYEILRKKFF